MNPLYTSIVFVSSISLLAIISGVCGNYLLPKHKRRFFVVLFVMLISLNWAEWLGVFLNGRSPDLRGLYVAAKFFELSVTPLVPVVCIKLLNSKSPLWIYAAPLFNVLLQTVSLFSGAVFSVDAASVYHRGALYCIYVATFVVGAAVLLAECVRFEHKCQNTGIVFLSMLMLLIGVSIAFPIIAPEFRLDWTCISFAALIFYVYFSQLALRIDITTSLLNRRYFEHEIHKIDDGSAVIFFDVDKFKHINDTYGHDYGDFVLSSVGETMKKVFSKNGVCCRFGGDELCVIMTKNPSAAEKLISEFKKKISDLRMKDDRFPDVSVGCAYFEENSESPDDCLKRADVLMYNEKALKSS